MDMDKSSTQELTADSEQRRSADCRRYFYPETAAGGFSHVDGTVAFYTRINALLQPEMTVLDFGAGRGRAVQEDPFPYRRALQTLQGKCRRLIGVDVDDAVLQHPRLDEAHILPEGGRLPIADGTVDLIVSDSTFEHIAQPEAVVPELDRVLKPGGWICARTPNRWGYIGLGTNLIPNRWHVRLLKYLQPHRKAVDVFPTTYRLNTQAALKKHFPENSWTHCSYGHFAEPAYFGTSKILWTLVLLSYRVTPSSCAPMQMVFLQKKS